MNELLLKEIKTNNINGTNRLIKACVIYIGNRVSLEPKRKCGNEEK